MRENQELGYLDHTNDESRVSNIEAARKKIPDLISGNNTTIQLLSNLHRESTQDSINGKHPLEQRASAAQTAMLAVGILDPESVTTYEPRAVLGAAANLELNDSLQIYMDTRGVFRKAATIKKYNSFTHKFSDEKIDVYHMQELRINDRFLFATPIFDVDKLMNAAANEYDKAIKNSVSIEESTLALARFYLTGISMIHPYIDGNARAFELFLEAEMAKNGKKLELPRDDRGKLERTRPPGQELDQLYDLEFAARHHIQLQPYRQYIFYPPNLFSEYYPTLNKKLMEGIREKGQRGGVGKIEGEFAEFLLAKSS